MSEEQLKQINTVISEEYCQMATGYIQWKKFHHKGLKAQWNYFVKQWQQGWRPKKGGERDKR